MCYDISLSYNSQLTREFQPDIHNNYKYIAFMRVSGTRLNIHNGQFVNELLIIACNESKMNEGMNNE